MQRHLGIQTGEGVAVHVEQVVRDLLVPRVVGPVGRPEVVLAGRVAERGPHLAHGLIELTRSRGIARIEVQPHLVVRYRRSIDLLRVLVLRPQNYSSARTNTYVTVRTHPTAFLTSFSMRCMLSTSS